MGQEVLPHRTYTTPPVFGPWTPCSPCGPCRPWSPRSPLSPIFPWGPDIPCGPCGPDIPVSPCGPGGPNLYLLGDQAVLYFHLCHLFLSVVIDYVCERLD